jgi:signal peptidase I
MDASIFKRVWAEEGVKDAVKLIVISLLLAAFMRVFLFQPFSIPSSSMEGTLLPGDYVFVSKFSYGYSRYSLPFSESLPGFGRVLTGQPSRGEVAVFRLPADPSQDYIKRVIGLPGDRVAVRGAEITVNGVAVKAAREGEAPIQCPDGLRVTELWRETWDTGASYLTARCFEAAAWIKPQEFVVPAGHYFVMGDNRFNSRDSRIASEAGGVGFVPAENFVGPAQVIFFSTTGGNPFAFWRWPWTIRFNRLFHGVQ